MYYLSKRKKLLNVTIHTIYQKHYLFCSYKNCIIFEEKTLSIVYGKHHFLFFSFLITRALSNCGKDKTNTGNKTRINEEQPKVNSMTNPPRQISKLENRPACLLLYESTKLSSCDGQATMCYIRLPSCYGTSEHHFLLRG